MNSRPAPLGAPLWILLAVLAAVVSLLLAIHPGATSSALSADASGWLLARRYVEERGVRVDLRSHPLRRVEPPDDTPPDEGTLDPDAVLVLAFPWQRQFVVGEEQALLHHLRGGGRVLYAYSRELEQMQEESILDLLGLEWRKIRSKAPLAPLPWWRHQREVWRLEPDAAWAAASPISPSSLEVRAFRAAPEAPANAEVFYRGADDLPLIFSVARQGGEVLVLPVEVFSNGQLLRSGNAEFLETVVRLWGDAWSFDEYHHGLVAASEARASVPRAAWDLFLIHLALFYLLALWMLGRRFGPPWREQPVAYGSAASFLLNLGTLHRELGHHARAAELLVERSAELDPALARESGGMLADARRRAAEIHDDDALLAFARDLARARSRRTP